jgi:hypothetical protein
VIVKNFVSAISVVLTLAAAAPPETQAASRIVPPHVPETLEVQEGFVLYLSGHAIGTQNYICTIVGGAPKWLFIGPQATLFDADGEQIITHFQSANSFKANAIQATWQDSRDTSAVWAVKYQASIDPNYVSPDAIEWLLLEVTGANFGPESGDRLSRTRFIQRVHTVGGREPAASACTTATLTNRQLVPYEADYFFYQ